MKAILILLGLVACEPLSASCDYDPVDITIPPAFTASLRVSPCVHVTAPATSGVCGDFGPSCVGVEPGERVRLWFPRDGFCGSDGNVYPVDSNDAPGFGLEYSQEPCP